MIAASSNRISYAGNGSSTVFAFPFSWTASSSVKVITRDDSNVSLNFGVETVKTLTTHYTLTGTSGAEGTGSVTFLVAPALNTTLTIIGNEAYTQGADFIENGSMPAEVQEAALDRLTRLVQQVKSAADRKVGLIEGFGSTFDPTLPSTVYGKAGYLLGLKPTEQGFDYINPATVAGPVGPQGIAGASGPPGATGLTGPAGSAGATGTGLTLGNKTDITVSGGAFDVWAINADRVTNAMLIDVAQNTFKSRLTVGMGDPQDITATQATAILDGMVGDAGAGGLKGLVPVPGAGFAAAGRFLKADGLWAVPSGTGGVSDGDKGDLTVTGAGATWTIDNDVVTNAKAADMATARIKGRTTALSGDPEDLTATQVTAMLNNVVGDAGAGGTKGLVPAPAAGDSAAGKFLKADGTYAVPPGGAGITDGDKGDITVSASGAAWAIDANVVTNAKAAQMATATFKGRTTALTGDPEDLTVAQATALLNVMTGGGGTGLKGLVPSQVAGDAAKFLRGDATWQVAGGGTAASTTFAPAGSIAATDVQAALVEVDGDVALKSNIASPTFTGTPAAPTATALTSTTQLATTAFVTAADAVVTAAVTALRTSGVFTGTSITPTAGARDQTALYTGVSAQTFSTTGFGTLASLTNGYRCLVMGSDDVNTISIADSNIADGRLMNGDAILGKGFVITFEYNSTLARMVEISRNF